MCSRMDFAPYNVLKDSMDRIVPRSVAVDMVGHVTLLQDRVYVPQVIKGWTVLKVIAKSSSMVRIVSLIVDVTERILLNVIQVLVNVNVLQGGLGLYVTRPVLLPTTEMVVQRYATVKMVDCVIIKQEFVSVQQDILALIVVQNVLEENLV